MVLGWLRSTHPCRRLGWLCAVALAACSSAPPKPEPAPLEAIAAPIAGGQAWSLSLGAPVAGPGTELVGSTWVLAAADGQVLAVDVTTGRELWRTSLGSPVAAGAGTDGRYAAVVTQGNELVVLDQGHPLWRAHLNSRVVTAPLVAGQRVFIQGLDRVVQAFDVLDGRPLWTQQRPGEALALAQAGVLLPFKNTLLVGFGARLTGLDATTGEQRFDVAMASPRGTNEVERLADLVAPAGRNADVVCARAFQTAVGCADAARGVLLWSHPLAGTQGIAMDSQVVVAADGSDRITAWRRAGGEVLWASERLRFRQLGAPVMVGSNVVFGDAKGMVHVMARDTGVPVLRLTTDETAPAAAVAMNNIVAVLTRGGHVFGFTLGSR